MRQLFTIITAVLLSSNLFASDDQSYLHYIMGDEMMFKGDILGALDEYREASLLDPGSAELRAKIASAYLEMGEMEKAEKEINKALKQNDSSLVVLRSYLDVLLEKKDYSKALTVCEEILSQTPEEKEVINYRVALMLEVGKKKEAFEFIKKYSKENPYEEFPYYYLGLITDSDGKQKEAESFFMTSLAINPEYEPSIFTLMLLYEKTYSGATLLKKLEQLSNNTGGVNDDLNNKIITLNMKLADTTNDTTASKNYITKAIDHLTKVYGDKPLPYIAIQKASLYEKMGDKVSAVKELEDASTNYPKNEALMFALAVLYDSYGKKENALKAMEKLAEINPNDPEVLNYIGYSYADNSIDFEKARKLLKKALNISPDDPYIIDSIGWLNYKEGKMDDAKKEMEKALELSKRKNIFEVEMFEHLLIIYKVTNNTDGKNNVKKLLTDVLNSKRHNDKRGVIKKLIESIDETPERSPASIKK